MIAEINNDIHSMEGDAYLALTEDEIEIMYHPELNIFVGEGGHQITNIFEFITPNDLFLYKSLHDPNEAFVIVGSRKRPTVLIHTYREGDCYCIFCDSYSECMGDWGE